MVERQLVERRGRAGLHIRRPLRWPYSILRISKLEYPSPDVAMTPALDPSALYRFEALRGHAESVANDGAELARALGLDAEPVAMADVREIARTIAAVARERGQQR